MFRDLIPLLADRFHVVAPDLPGFGHSRCRTATHFTYTFEPSPVIGRFTEVVGPYRFAIYVFDYGAPVGFRLALQHPERITAIISQNGNAYEEGLSEGWNPIQRYWREPTRRTARRCASSYARDDPLAIRPWRARRDAGLAGGYALDFSCPARQRRDPARLFLDYASNVALYPEVPGIFPHAPAAASGGLGQERSVLPAAGAEAFRRDIPDAEVHFLDTGHFALETHGGEIADAIREFLASSGASRRRRVGDCGAR